MRRHVAEEPNPSKRVVLVTAAALAVAAALVVAPDAPRLHAQSQSADASKATFEVASIKPNKSGDGRVMMGLQPGGRYTATNITLGLLIRQAYQLQNFQLVGGPSWLDSDHFDIVAKSEGSVPLVPPGQGPGPIQFMIRALLAERFKLTVHHESRELPMYALVKARSDGKPGPQLRPAAVDCAAMIAARGRGGPPPPGPGGPGGPPGGPIAPGERPACGLRIGPGNIAGGGIPISQFATTLSTWVNRIVQDRTGLTGNFDIDLQWTPEQMPQARGVPPPGAPALPPVDPNGPSIFTAVQEQLGLKLDSQKGPVDVLVIDRVEQPTED